MIRKPLVFALGLVLAISGASTAATFPAAAPGASAVGRTVHDAAACGDSGFNLITAPATEAGFLCVHAEADHFVSSKQARAQASMRGARGPAVSKVPCYGDGTTGPRIQWIYGYFDGIANRGVSETARLRTVVAPRMQAIIDAQSFGGKGIRFAMTPGCKAIDVKVIRFPRSVQYTGDPFDPGGVLGRAASYLASIGMDRGDRKYQIVWDGFTVRGVCGIGESLPIAPVTSAPRQVLFDGIPTVGSRTGVSTPLVVRKYSVIFNHVGGPRSPSCGPLGLSGVTAEVHELFHTLGAVQTDAPHSDGGGHCVDAPSVMCPGGTSYAGGIANPSCVRVLVEVLDCGKDDYWNTDPQPASYLGTHLNIAKSPFFGSQPEDLLVAAPL